MDDHKFMAMKIVFIYNIWLDICMLLSLSIFFLKIILVNINSFWFQHSLSSSKVKFGGSLSFLSKIGFILKFWKTCFQMQEK